MKKLLWFLVSICATSLSLFVTACGSGYTKTVNILTVNSNTASGVAINPSPADINGARSGTTSFMRSYSPGTVVTLTAPATSGGNAFSSWTGCFSTSAATCVVTMNTDMAVTATYSVATSLTPTVTVTPSSSSITTAQSLSVKIAVTGNGSNPPTGSITLTSGGYTSPATTLLNGSATITVAAGALSVGSEILTAIYTPDGASAPVYNSATGANSLTVTSPSLLTPTVTVTPSSSSITAAQFLSVRVAVSGSGSNLPTGSVILSSGNYNSAATTLSNGSATITVAAGALAVGLDTLTAMYTPDGASASVYNSTTGTSPLTITAPSLMTPTVIVTPSSTSITAAQSLSVKIAVTGNGSNQPTGSVILTNGNYSSAATTLSNGSATITVAAGALAVGSDILTAMYAPDSASASAYNSATGTSPLTVASPSLMTPTVIVTPSSSSITTAQPLSVKVAVTGNGSNPPTGSISLTSGGYTSPATTLSNGNATITIAAGALGTGSDTLAATFTPDSASKSIYSGATGTGSTVTVTPLTPTVTLTLSAASITTAQLLSVKITVSGGTGSPSPTGSITLASGNYISPATTLTSGGTTINVAAGTLAVGSDTLTATFTPDSESKFTYNGATGTSGAVTVTSPGPQMPTVTVTPSPTSITTAQSLIVTIAVGGSTGNPVPTGSVILTSGGYTSLSTMLSSGNATITIAVGKLSMGADTLKATYTPDVASAASYSGATGTGIVAVGSPGLLTPTVTVVPVLSSITTAQPLIVTIAVSGGAGNPVPTGSVTLTSGGFTLPAAAALTNGSATIPVPAGALAIAADTLTSTYTPDSASQSTYNVSAGTGTVTVTDGSSAPMVTLTASPNTISAGGSSTLTWSTTNANSCTASGGWSGPQSTSGSQSVTPAATSFFTITCTGTVGTASATATTDVGVVFSYTNAQAPLGINLGGIYNSSPEQPFLNIFKTESTSASSPTGWITHSNSAFDTGEEAYLQLDANGYPTTLAASSADPNKPQQFTSVGVQLLLSLPASNAGNGTVGPTYRAGQYIVLYDGEGTITYQFDAQKDTADSTPGRDVLNITKPTGGFFMVITSTDPNHTGDYIRNIRVVRAEEEAALKSGQIFDPYFLGLIQKFHALRFMDWLQTNNNTLYSWSNRPQVTDAGWSPFFKGVPLEVPIALCNTVSADCWLNVPVMTDDNYITEMATLVHNQLSPNLHVYVEFSNEVWNYGFQQTIYAQQQGQAMFPSDPSVFDALLNWKGMRVAKMCDIWASVWGSDFNRVHCVLGSQAASASTATTALDCKLWTGAGNAPCYKHHITDVAIAPYFGDNDLPESFPTSEPLSAQLNDLFNEIETGGAIPGNGNHPHGYLAEVAQWEKNYKTALGPPYNLPFVAYEGGEGFSSFSNWLGVEQPQGIGTDNDYTSLYNAANLDPRMSPATTAALTNWMNNGGNIYMYFTDIGAYSRNGEWGALQDFLDTVTPQSSAPPKWQALQNFIANNPCWWSGCSQ